MPNLAFAENIVKLQSADSSELSAEIVVSALETLYSQLCFALPPIEIVPPSGIMAAAFGRDPARFLESFYGLEDRPHLEEWQNIISQSRSFKESCAFLELHRSIIPGAFRLGLFALLLYAQQHRGQKPDNPHYIDWEAYADQVMFLKDPRYCGRSQPIDYVSLYTALFFEKSQLYRSASSAVQAVKAFARQYKGEEFFSLLHLPSTERMQILRNAAGLQFQWFAQDDAPFVLSQKLVEDCTLSSFEALATSDFSIEALEDLLRWVCAASLFQYLKTKSIKDGPLYFYYKYLCDPVYAERCFAENAQTENDFLCFNATCFNKADLFLIQADHREQNVFYRYRDRISVQSIVAASFAEFASISKHLDWMGQRRYLHRVQLDAVRVVRDRASLLTGFLQSSLSLEEQAVPASRTLLKIFSPIIHLYSPEDIASHAWSTLIFAQQSGEDGTRYSSEKISLFRKYFDFLNGLHPDMYEEHCRNRMEMSSLEITTMQIIWNQAVLKTGALRSARKKIPTLDMASNSPVKYFCKDGLPPDFMGSLLSHRSFFLGFWALQQAKNSREQLSILYAAWIEVLRDLSRTQLGWFVCHYLEVIWQDPLMGDCDQLWSMITEDLGLLHRIYAAAIERNAYDTVLKVLEAGLFGLEWPSTEENILLSIDEFCKLLTYFTASDCLDGLALEKSFSIQKRAVAQIEGASALGFYKSHQEALSPHIQEQVSDKLQKVFFEIQLLVVLARENARALKVKNSRSRLFSCGKSNSAFVKFKKSETKAYQPQIVQRPQTPEQELVGGSTPVIFSAAALLESANDEQNREVFLIERLLFLQGALGYTPELGENNARCFNSIDLKNKAMQR